jgi:hypothetical protein
MDGARERIWLQSDAAWSPAAAATVAWAALESLASDRASPYRQLVAGRAAFVVIGPAAYPVDREPHDRIPLLDCGALGGTQPILEAMVSFRPTLVIHLQDWTAPTHASPLQIRAIESFLLDSDLHQRLDAEPRQRLGRPTASTRALAAHPDARLGQAVARALARAGTPLSDLSGDAQEAVRHEPFAAGAIRLAEGRYAPAREWRQIGAGSLCEIALRECGATGFAFQLSGGPTQVRAGAALAAAEAVVLGHLGLGRAETPA